MRDLLQLALLAAQAALPAQPDRNRRPPWCIAAAAAMLGLWLLVAGGFLLTAAWLFLLPLVGAPLDALIIGLVALLKALCIGLLLRHWQRGAAAPRPGPSLAGLVHTAEATVQAHKTATLLAALLAGLVAGSADPRRP